ncbi:hypothetical protein BSL78_22885 [Apostichopus japonicus]|uniref:Uncharacterized protein n=1 Tax=Stichopus japonicus TaxID=307972 RepID=A0A2G8JX56_STIJA|nr:hypothetical protein BSL78_22885 [Apostichopus japonicus]
MSQFLPNLDSRQREDYRNIQNADVFTLPEEFKNDIKWQKRSKLGETRKNEIEGGTAELNVETFGDEHMDIGTAKLREEADTIEELDTGSREEADNVGEEENEQRAETFKDIESEPLHAKTNGKELLEKETPKSTNLMLDTGTEDKGNNDMLETKYKCNVM